MWEEAEEGILYELEDGKCAHMRMRIYSHHRITLADVLDISCVIY